MLFNGIRTTTTEIFVKIIRKIVYLSAWIFLIFVLVKTGNVTFTDSKIFFRIDLSGCCSYKGGPFSSPQSIANCVHSFAEYLYVKILVISKVCIWWNYLPAGLLFVSLFNSVIPREGYCQSWLEQTNLMGWPETYMKYACMITISMQFLETL